MSNAGIEALLSQMRSIGEIGKSASTAGGLPSVADGVDFKAALKQAIQDVSTAQNTAQSKVQAFSAGDASMTMEEVMVSLQKANLSFQTMIVVRNRLVEAYREITNLQV